MPPLEKNKLFASWLTSTVLTRLTVTSIPMVSVVGMSAAGGSYVLGGITSGAYAIGETLGAILITPRLSGKRIGRRLFQGCLVSAALLSISGLLAVSGSPLRELVPLMVFATGAISAPIPGVLRSSVSQFSRDPDRAMGLDNVINQVCWVVGPVIGVAAVHGAGTMPAFILLGGFLFVSMLTSPQAISVEYEQSSGSTAKPNPRIVVIPIVASAVIMAVTASFDTLVPILLTGWRGTDSLTGWILAALAASSVLVSAILSARTQWEGKQSKAAFFTLFAVLLLSLTGFAPSLSMLFAAAIFLGIAQAPAMIFRQQIIADAVPASQQATAFSYLYAAGGVGYSITAALTPTISRAVSTGAATAVVGALCLAALSAGYIYTKSSSPE